MRIVGGADVVVLRCDEEARGLIDGLLPRCLIFPSQSTPLSDPRRLSGQAQS